MAQNFPGPYAVEYKYAVTINSQVLVHSFEVNCAVIGNPSVGTVPGAIAVQTKSGASLALLTAVNDVWNIYRTGLSASVAVSNGWTLWKYVEGTLAKDFISAGTVTNTAGSGGVTPTPAGQTKATFRTANGGIMQLNQIEGSNATNTSGPLTPAGTGAWWVVLASYALSASGWMIARDDSYPVAALNVAHGQNEVTFRKRFRAA